MASPRTLLPYQRRWVQDPTPLKVCEKSRRIGLSWAAAYDAVMYAGSGQGDVRYQTYSRDGARDWIGDCADWAGALQVGAEAIGETLIGGGAGEAIQAFRIECSSGRRIFAMPASPRVWRGKGRPGERALLDEAAFVDDIEAVLKAALATRMWGGEVHVISTHNGEGSPFDALVRDVRSGSRPGAVHRTTLADAVADGLFRRVAAVAGTPWSPEAETAWVDNLRAEYGSAAAEELDCIPDAGGGAWLAWPLIHAAEDAEAGDPERFQSGLCAIGVDVARRRDLWVAWVVEAVGDVLWTREVVAERGLTFRGQADEIARLVARYRPSRIAIDQTGMGEMPVEEAQRRYGASVVEGVLMSAPRQLDLATALRERLEDRRLRLPADDAELRRDLRAVRRVVGVTGGPRLVTERTGDGSHADRFWALALAVGAAAMTWSAAYTPATTARRRPSNDDADRSEGRADWDAIAPRARF